MKRQDPIEIVMALWEQVNMSPWITLKLCHTTSYEVCFKMEHSKTGGRQLIPLASKDIYRIDDCWTYKYVVEQLTTALAALTHNTAEAGVSSIDVYREDYPA